jgi:hypothetical protein
VTDPTALDTAPAVEAEPATSPPAARKGALGTPRRRLVAELAAVALLLLICAVVHRTTMNQQLVEEHGFRQTQTAMTAVDFERYGIDLLHPRVAVFGARAELPFEFPLFQAMATVPMNLGLDTDMALRVTAFGCFLLTAVLLWGLIRRVGGRVAAFAALVAFLFSPFGLLWSRASLVEYLATAGAVGFVWAGIEWRERRHWAFVALAVVAGALAMLVKITTGVFWIVPLVLYTAAKELPGWRAWLRARLEPGLIVAVVLPLVAGFWWTRHADAIKAADSATDWLTSAHLESWNFGTLAQRQVAGNWATIFDRIEQLLVGRSLVVVVLVAALWIGRRQKFWLGLALAALLPPIVLFNLYWAHDYYLAAISPALAGLVGVVAAWVWEHRPKRWPAAVVAVLMAAVWLGWVVWPESDYFDRMNEPVADSYALAAGEVQRVTDPSELVVYLGEEWNPTTPYYADRPGFMLTSQIADRATVERLARDDDYRYVFSFNPYADPIHFLDAWPWVGVIGPRTYVVGQQREDVDDAPVFASTRASAASGATGGGTALPCDGQRVAIAGGGAPIGVSAPDSEDVRIIVGHEFAPLPRVGTVYSRDDSTLECSGVRAVEVVTAPTAA